MSNGGFTTAARYEISPATTTPVVPARVTTCRVQPETLLLTIGGVINDQSTAAVTLGIPRATINASSRKRGIIRARGVRVQFVSIGSTAYKQGVTIFLPWMVQGTWSAIPESGGTGVYQTLNINVISKRAGSVT